MKKLNKNELYELTQIIHRRIREKRSASPLKPVEEALFRSLKPKVTKIDALSSKLKALSEEMSKLSQEKSSISYEINNSITQFNKKQKNQKTSLDCNYYGKLSKIGNVLSDEAKEINDTLFLKNIASSNLEEAIEELLNKY